MSQLQDFINQYTNQPNVGDTPENTNECVGLIEVWTDYLGLTHTWGNAKDLLANANRDAFEVIYNTPDGVPSPGDIFCFDGNYGGGVGHTGVVVTADVNTVTLFQQNDPTNSNPYQKTYTYNHAIGWMHPKVLDAPAPQPQPQPEPTNGDEPMNAEQEKQAYEIVLGREPEGDASGRTAMQFINDAAGELAQHRADVDAQFARMQAAINDRDATIAALRNQPQPTPSPVPVSVPVIQHGPTVVERIEAAIMKFVDLYVNTHPKVKAAGAGGILTTAMVFLGQAAGVNAPADLSSFLTAVVAITAGYLKSNK